MDPKRTIRDALFGLAVGDALGVPAEFKSRAELAAEPVRGMTGWGSHDQPPGTWSDDSSLSFCLAEALIGGFDLPAMADQFMRWFYEAHWTPHGNVFDVGNVTRQAIGRLRAGTRPDLAGGHETYDNGNGSLMRVLPLVFYIRELETGERWRLARLAGSVTHAHIRSVIGCFYYLEYARLLLQGLNALDAYKAVQPVVLAHLAAIGISPDEVHFYHRLLYGNIYECKEDEIHSSGYVVHTLEASLWCLLTTTNYADAVLKAVNLGEDTDTTAAVTGGLAGLLYGLHSIPSEWLQVLARRNDIDELADRFEAVYP